MTTVLPPKLKSKSWSLHIDFKIENDLQKRQILFPLQPSTKLGN